MDRSPLYPLAMPRPDSSILHATFDRAFAGCRLGRQAPRPIAG
jgi:hypothetical protein